MRFSHSVVMMFTVRIISIAILLFAIGARSADLLFVTGFTGSEISQATAAGFTSDTVSTAFFSGMSTTAISAYKAVIIGDPFCSSSYSTLSYLDSSKTRWSPAITGNIVILGTDPSFHFRGGVKGAGALITNSINFAAANPLKTGLYLALSCYGASSSLSFLSAFGNFATASGNSDRAHIVASSPALGTLSDSDIANWGQSTHEYFTSFPSSFQALAIIEGITGTGYRTYSDGSGGVPYIIAVGTTPSGCGDRVLQPPLGEECDDGNKVSGDGCSMSCKCEIGRPTGRGCASPQCGDGYYAPTFGEECDDGNLVSGDGCSATCKCESGLPDGIGGCKPAMCGDGRFSVSTEQCEDGNTVSGDGCSDTCKCELGLPDDRGGCRPPVCGDGLFYPAGGEQCDDGNTVPGDGCSATCKCEIALPNGSGGCQVPMCGDGVFDPATEKCEDGNKANGDGCSATCECEVSVPDGKGGCLPPTCGDGVFNAATGEECDGKDGCSTTCKCLYGLPDGTGNCNPPVCGDGIFVSASEQCDDGNVINGDGCSSDCRCEIGLPDSSGGCLAPVCGDGLFAPSASEQCDDENLINGDGCSSTCKCEVGLPTGTGTCNLPRCGDGIYAPAASEECDDGNNVDGDGCSATCTCEFGLPLGDGLCAPPVCGDGVFDLASEQCDPAVIVDSASVCSSTCKCVTGLPDGRGACLPSVCGDGIYNPLLEFCDDGNIVDGDGCSSTCKCEVGLPDGAGGCLPPRCGDGIWQPQAGEQCDGISTLGCSSTCVCSFARPNGVGGCLVPICGDGIFQPAFGEQCDTELAAPGDGCDVQCRCGNGTSNGLGGCYPYNATTSPTSSSFALSTSTSATLLISSIPYTMSMVISNSLSSSITTSVATPVTITTAPAGSTAPSQEPLNVVFRLTANINTGSKKRQSTSLYGAIQLDGTISVTPNICEASAFNVSEGYFTSAGKFAIASVEDVQAGTGFLRFGSPSGVYKTFSIIDSVLTWSNESFGNGNALFGIDTDQDLIRVFYSGAPTPDNAIAFESVSSETVHIICDDKISSVISSAGPTTVSISAGSKAVSTSAGSTTLSTSTGSTIASETPTTPAASASMIPYSPVGNLTLQPGGSQSVFGFESQISINIQIGIEIILDVNISRSEVIIGGSTVMETHMTAYSSTVNPIYNMPVIGYPCYVCEMMKEGIPCPTNPHFTITSTRYKACEGATLPTTNPLVFQPCATCLQTAMTGTPIVLTGASAHVSTENSNGMNNVMATVPDIALSTTTRIPALTDTTANNPANEIYLTSAPTDSYLPKIGVDTVLEPIDATSCLSTETADINTVHVDATTITNSTGTQSLTDTKTPAETGPVLFQGASLSIVVFKSTPLLLLALAIHIGWDFIS